MVNLPAELQDNELLIKVRLSSPPSPPLSAQQRSHSCPYRFLQLFFCAVLAAAVCLHACGRRKRTRTPER